MFSSHPYTELHPLNNLGNNTVHLNQVSSMTKITVSAYAFEKQNKKCREIEIFPYTLHLALTSYYNTVNAVNTARGKVRRPNGRRPKP